MANDQSGGVGSSQSSFFATMQPYAMSAGAVLGMPFQVILAQWALESTYGTSDVSQRAKNFAGIKYHDKADFKSGSYAGYNSVGNFVKDYIRVLQLPYYNEVRGAGGIAETIDALGRSPYAEDSSYATKITSIINNYNLSGGPVGVIGNAGAIGGIVGGIAGNPFLWIGLFIIYLLKK